MESSFDKIKKKELAPTPLPIGRKIEGFVFLGKNKHELEEYRHSKTGIEFVLIPEGSFMMGSDKNSDEKPIHEVTVPSFLLGKYEVTQEQWEKEMRENPSSFQKGEKYPVEKVSWEDCQKYCAKVGLRLPSEAEWEYACRAGTKTEYYWGNEIDGDYLWYSDNSNSQTHEVGEKKTNGFGLYDMSGNVWEWCEDAYASDYSKAPKDGSAYIVSGADRVIRGGSWGSSHPGGFRSALRLGGVPSFRILDLGFRLARSLK